MGNSPSTRDISDIPLAAPRPSTANGNKLSSRHNRSTASGGGVGFGFDGKSDPRAGGGNDKLHVAAQMGDIAALRQLIETERVPVDATVAMPRFGTTPLIVAARSGQLAAVRYLVSVGANVRARDEDGWTALKEASTVGHAPIVALLRSVNGGMDEDLQDEVENLSRGLTLTEAPHLDAPLLSSGGAGASVVSNVADPRRLSSALHLAAAKGHTDTLKALLAAGGDVRSVDHWGCTPLIRAVVAGHIPAVTSLLEARSEVDTRDYDGCTALHHACVAGNVDIIRQLFAAGADVKKATPSGVTTLMIAAANGHTALARGLAGGGVNVNQCNHHGVTALMLASAGGHQTTVEALVAAGALVATPAESATALWHSKSPDFSMEDGSPTDKYSRAASTGSGEWAFEGKETRGASESGTSSAFSGGELTGVHLQSCSPNSCGSHIAPCSTALHVAADIGSVATIQYLLSVGADVRASDYRGCTPLVRAVRHGHTAAVKVLLDAHSQVEDADAGGRTALLHACMSGNVEVARQLLAAGANPHHVARNGDTALMMASACGCTTLVRDLVSAGVDVNRVNHRRLTALMVAAMFGHSEAAEVLVAAGSKLDAVAADGETAWLFAQRGHADKRKLMKVLRPTSDSK